MPNTKVSLSAEELKLVTDCSWLNMKQGIVQKVYEMFADSVADIDRIFDEKGVFNTYSPVKTSPKISKGENYMGLPWVMLDYPRDFGASDVFSLRTFFWWGHFFSLSLHLSGRYRQLFMERWGDKPMPDEFHFCVHETPWQHYFAEDNLVPARTILTGDYRETMQQRDFLKWVLRFELDGWNQMPDLLRAGYVKMAEILV